MKPPDGNLDVALRMHLTAQWSVGHLARRRRVCAAMVHAELPALGDVPQRRVLADSSRGLHVILAKAGEEDLPRADALVLRRATLGAPKAWESMILTPEEELRYREVLLGNNLDLLLHRLCYWADGRRNLLDITARLEVELYELLNGTAIARTASSSQITGATVRFDLTAVLHTADLLVSNGYLELADA